MIALVQLRNGHHIANLMAVRARLLKSCAPNAYSSSDLSCAYLRVLVGFGTKEWFTVYHRDGLFGTLFKSLKLSQISLRVHETSPNSICVPGDGTNDTDTRVVCFAHVIEKEIDEKKVSKVINALEPNTTK